MHDETEVCGKPRKKPRQMCSKGSIIFECAQCVAASAERDLLARVQTLAPPLRGPKRHSTKGTLPMLPKPHPMDWHEAHAFMLEHHLTIPPMEAIYDANGDLLPNSAEIILKVLREQDTHGGSAKPEGAKTVEPNAKSKKAARKSVGAATCGICNQRGNKTRSLKECR